MDIPQIVILGAGVSGLRIAKKLKRELRPGEADLLLVDQNDYHQLLYRLHKVCNYEYAEKDIIVPLKRLIKDIPFKKATVETIDIETDTVKTD
ncbi:FAD-dependent oxidoreductase, partial [Candidatus Bathyarchaeota archaeon]|nr:FAD-dependent oxidoreductase [Candidatus Bathyarchaeota archaeon]